jgi:hypothetical protein
VNNYARLSQVKSDLGIPSNSTTEDARLLVAIESVSRAIDDSMVGHPIYPHTATHYYRGRSTPCLNLPHMLVSVSSVTVDADRDGTYELTLVQDTDYWLGPQSHAGRNRPYWELELNPNGTQLWSWPTGTRTTKVTGIWGWSQETTDSGLTGTLADATDTTITASASAVSIIEPGDTLLIESEQVYVTALSSGPSTTITVQRGVNGTTAAAHSAKALLRIVYPGSVVEACLKWGQRDQWDRSLGQSTGSVNIVEGGSPGYGSGHSWAQIKTLLAPFRNMVVA